jgi:serine/threonine protein kinase
MVATPYEIHNHFKSVINNMRVDSKMSLYDIDEPLLPFSRPVMKIVSVVTKTIQYPSFSSTKKVLQCESTGRLFEEGIELKTARFGKVHRIYSLERDHNRSDESYIRSEERLVVKKFSKRAILCNSEKAENPLSEIATLQLLSSLNTSINDTHLPGFRPYYDCFVDFDTIYLITPFYDSGDLLDVIFSKERRSHERFSIFEMKEMFSQIVKQLKFLHDNGIVHRDISLENILYDKESNQYCLIDYGMSLLLRQKAQTSTIEDADDSTDEETSVDGHSFNEYSRFHTISRYSICGKQQYIAPEIWNHSTDIQYMLSDIWSLGISFFMILMFQGPFDEAKINDRNYHYFLKVGSIHELLYEMNHRQSIIVDKVENEHTDYNLLIDLLNKMLKPNQKDRITISNILLHPFFD